MGAEPGHSSAPLEAAPALDEEGVPPDEEGPPLDGRHARRDRNRLAVLDAALEIFGEGTLQPRADEIAKRAGVSLRSLYRYFPETADLYRAAMDLNFDRASPAALMPDVGQGPLGDRIERCVQSRLDLQEAFAPMVRMAYAAALTHEMVRDRLDLGRRLLLDQVERHFAPELELLPPARRAAVVGAIDLMCQLETVNYLRAARQLSRAEAGQVMTAGLTALLLAAREAP